MGLFGNKTKTFLLLGLLTVIIMMLGQAMGGRQGMVIAFLFASVMNFFSYWYSDRIVLKLYRAREAGREEYPELHRMVEDLSRRAGLPVPGIYIIPQDSPNAFATGRDYRHAALGVTQGILKMLNREELEGVLAHELSHVKNRDTLIGTVAATMAGAIMLLARFAQWAAIFGGGDDDDGGGLGLLAAAIVAPIAAIFIQMAISRSREYLADSTGVRIAGQPFGLAGALEKLGAASSRVPMKGDPSTSHLFIVNPLRGSGLMKLFSTHPPMEERIRRLRTMNY